MKGGGDTGGGSGVRRTRLAAGGWARPLMYHWTLNLRVLPLKAWPERGGRGEGADGGGEAWVRRKRTETREGNSLSVQGRAGLRTRARRVNDLETKRRRTEMGATAEGEAGLPPRGIHQRVWPRSDEPDFPRVVAFHGYRGGGNPRRLRQLCRSVWRGRSPLGAPRRSDPIHWSSSPRECPDGK